MKILVLDDSKERQKNFARNLIGNEVYQAFDYREAVQHLTNHSPFDLVFLDHDLSEETEGQLLPSGIVQIPVNNECGVDVAKFIRSMPPEKHPTEAIIHSLNSDGAKNIASILDHTNIKYSIINYPSLLKGWNQ